MVAKGTPPASSRHSTVALEWLNGPKLSKAWLDEAFAAAAVYSASAESHVALQRDSH